MDGETEIGKVLPGDGPGKSDYGVVRHLSAGLGAALEQFEDPTLLAEGKISIIALDAVVQRFGTRWPLRREQVYDHVENTLDRYLGNEGYYLRISETDFIICQPALGRFAGQASAIRYLREILSHFLGEAHLADNCVHQVNKISQTGVEAAKVDARHVEVAEVHEEQEAAEARAEAETTARTGTMDRWTPFVAADGRTLRVSCTLEPVFELKGYGRIGFRLARRVLVSDSDEELSAAAVSNLPRADILRIDMATIARGMDRLRAESGERQPSLIVPVSFTSLSSQKGRLEIVEAFKEASGLVQRGVICEICDVEGVPQVALLSASSLIRPFALFVVGRLQQTPPGAVSQLKGAGLQAISFECPPCHAEAEFIGWAKASIEAAKQIAKSVLVYRTPSARYAGLVALMGATHASVMASETSASSLEDEPS